MLKKIVATPWDLAQSVLAVPAVEVQVGLDSPRVERIQISPFSHSFEAGLRSLGGGFFEQAIHKFTAGDDHGFLAASIFLTTHGKHPVHDMATHLFLGGANALAYAINLLLEQHSFSERFALATPEAVKAYLTGLPRDGQIPVFGKPDPFAVWTAGGKKLLLRWDRAEKRWAEGSVDLAHLNISGMWLSYVPI